MIATGYATPEFRPLAGRFRMYRTYVLATEPISAARRGRLGLSDVMVWDAERPYHYARWTPTIACCWEAATDWFGLARGVGRCSRQRYESCARISKRRLPALAGVETQLAWEGLFAMTPDSSAVHRAASPLSAPLVRLGLRWERHDVRLPGGATASRAMAGCVSRDHALFEFGRMRSR